MSGDDFKLNSLSRFSKKSPRLVLEQYDNCEVPAGCGGMVMRWRKPDEPLMMFVDVNSCAKRLEITLDGVDASWYRQKINWGAHVFTLTFQNVDLTQGFLLFAAQLEQQYRLILEPDGEPDVFSRPDGKWKYTLSAPSSENWRTVDFDDSTWSAMIAKPMPNQYWHGYDASDFYQKTRDKGAEDLGVDAKGKSKAEYVYVRRVFTIQPNSKQSTEE